MTTAPLIDPLAWYRHSSTGSPFGPDPPSPVRAASPRKSGQSSAVAGGPGGVTAAERAADATDVGGPFEAPGAVGGTPTLQAEIRKARATEKTVRTPTLLDRCTVRSLPTRTMRHRRRPLDLSSRRPLASDPLPCSIALGRHWRHNAKLLDDVRPGFAHVAIAVAIK